MKRIAEPETAGAISFFSRSVRPGRIKERI